MYQLESERFIFKTLSKKHITTQYVDWLNDPEVNAYLETRMQHQDLQKVLSFVAAQNQNPQVYLLGIFCKQNSQHIGNIKIGPVNEFHQSADISLFIGNKDFWHKGVATEALHTVTLFGFEQLHLKKITAGCYQANQASKSALLKMGYKVEGILREQVSTPMQRMDIIKLGILPGELIKHV